MNWGHLEKKYRIVIEANKATVFKRAWLGRDRPFLTATAILGTKAVEVTMNPQNGVPVAEFDVEAEEAFTESNLESELRMMCLFLLAYWDAAQKTVNSGE